MKKTLTVLSLSALVASVVSAAEISGKVTLSGTPAPEKAITLDAACGKLQTKPITTRHYVVGADKGLADVFVYVKGAAPAPAPATKGPMLDQVGCEYTPYVIGVQAGQKFDVQNSDAGVLHNVHTLPKVAGNKEKNVGQPVKGMKTEFSFDKPEVFVQFKCDVHPWMFAYVGVAENSFFAVTDKDGNFKISGLPAGEYTVEAVHRKAGTATEKVKVGADDKKTASFTLKVPTP